MGIKERVSQYLEYKGISDYRFEKDLGLSKGYWNKAKNPSYEILMRICGIYTDISPEWLLTGEGKMLKDDLAQQGNEVAVAPVEVMMPKNLVPLIPLFAQGGRLNDFTQAVKPIDCEKVISPIKGAEFAITVTGDSMSPEYPNGAQVLIKRIDEKAFIDWGRVYVLDTCNGIVIKQIMPASEESKVKCVSINPKYPPFEVSLQDVFGLYRVLMCMSLK